MSRPSLAGTIISGLILAGVPFVAIAQHWHVQAKDDRFVVLSELYPLGHSENVDISSEINRLDLEELSGSDNIKARDSVYVHMAAGPEKIAYPFGISKTKTKIRSDEHAFSVKGTVRHKEGSVIDVRYNFETFLPSKDMTSALNSGTPSVVQVELAVNKQATARLVAIEINGQRYPYRVIEKPELNGLTR